MERAIAQAHPQAGAAEFVLKRRIRRRLAQVALDEQMHAAARAAGGDGEQALASRFAEGGWKTGDDEETIFLGDGTRLFVVFRDVRELVAEIHLDDFFDVLVELRKTFFNVS